MKDLIPEFLKNKVKRRFFSLCLLFLFACADFLLLGLVRRTFVFYSIDDIKTPVVEDRMLVRAGSREYDIARYVEEALLGPVSLDSAPLFPKGTRLESLLYRDGVVYADLTESAAMPSLGGVDVFTGVYTLYGGIRRNFSYVKDVRLFINGHEAISGKIRENFAENGDILSSDR
ncbi:hypothetical protein AGMMS49944_19940 [Spirochaetia bacterium]|nr:hypothetical protein AGMMS49944_19940 [Spirochaetia bacterium]